MTYAAEAGELSLALVGDIMPARRLGVFDEPNFLALRDLVAGADACFANLESVVARYGEGTPTVREGTHMLTEPELLDDLLWFGFDIVSCANSHSMNFGEAGLLRQLEYLDAAGITHAGTGPHLRAASSPAYRDTHNGRIAVVAATAHLPENRALNQRVDFPGKPGVNALGWETSFDLDRDSFEALYRIAESLGFVRERARVADFGFHSASEVGETSATRLRFRGDTFVSGDGFDIHTACREADLEESLRQLREARRQADWVIASLHNQDSEGRAWLSPPDDGVFEEHPEFVTEYAHACVDAGADVVALHGPHTLMGVEIYKGKPIFHSLGNFILQNESVQHLPAVAYERFGLSPYGTPSDFFDHRTGNDTRGMMASSKYWEAALAVCEFSAGQACEIKLYPVDLGFGLRRPQRGRPVLATGESGSAILDRIGALSERFGTQLSRHEDHASILVGAEAR